MTAYEKTLLAFGVSPEEATRADWANELVRFQNREHPSYGKTADEQEKEH